MCPLQPLGLGGLRLPTGPHDKTTGTNYLWTMFCDLLLLTRTYFTVAVRAVGLHVDGEEEAGRDVLGPPGAERAPRRRLLHQPPS